MNSVEPPEGLEHMIRRIRSTFSPVDHCIGARLGDQERDRELDRNTHKTELANGVVNTQ